MGIKSLNFIFKKIICIEHNHIISQNSIESCKIVWSSITALQDLVWEDHGQEAHHSGGEMDSVRSWPGHSGAQAGLLHVQGMVDCPTKQCNFNTPALIVSVQISWPQELRIKLPTWEVGILARYRLPGSHPCQWTMSSPPPGPGHTRTRSWPGCSSRCRSWATCRLWTWRGRCTAPPTAHATPAPAPRPESASRRSHCNPGSRPRECMGPGNETIKLCPETQQTNHGDVRLLWLTRKFK